MVFYKMFVESAGKGRKTTSEDAKSEKIEAKVGQKCAKREPKGAKESQKGAKREPKGAKGSPKGAKGSPKGCQKGNQNASWNYFCAESEKWHQKVIKMVSKITNLGAIFHEKNNEKIDAKTDAEKGMEIDENSMRKWYQH